MKTAKEILEEFIKEDEHNGKNVYLLYPEDAIKAMKLYANQKLEEAAEKAKYEVLFQSDKYPQYHSNVINTLILSLKDDI